MQEIIKYEVSIRKADKNLYFYGVTEGEKLIASGQAMGIGEAMNRVNDATFTHLENEGRVK